MLQRAKNFNKVLKPALCYIRQDKNIGLAVKNVEPETLSGNISQGKPFSNHEIAFDNKFFDIDINLKRFGRVDKQNVFQLVKEMNKKASINLLHALLLIRCCGNVMVSESLSSKRELIANLFNVCMQKDLKFEITHFNSLLKVFTENKDFGLIDKLFQESSKIDSATADVYLVQQLKLMFPAQLFPNNLTPNRITYQRFVSYVCESGNMEKGEVLLQCLKDKGISLNETIFISLINGYASKGDIENVKGIVQIMKNMDIDMSSAIYGAIAKALISCGQSQQINEYLKEALENGVNFNNRDMFDVISHAIITQSSSSALNSQIEDKNVSFNAANADWKSVTKNVLPYIKPHGDMMQCLINSVHKLLSYDNVNRPVNLDLQAYEMFKYFSFTIGQTVDPSFIFNNELKNSGYFIVKHMAEQKEPAHSFNDLATIIKDLHGNELNNFASQRLLESFFNQHCLPSNAGNKNLKSSTPTLDEFMTNYKKYFQLMRDTKQVFRPHYFWPLFAKIRNSLNSRQSSPNDTLKHLFSTLKAMKNEYDCVPNVTTFHSYVYPTLLDAQNIMTSFEKDSTNSNENQSGSMNKYKGVSIEMSEELAEAMDEDYEMPETAEKNEEISKKTSKTTTIFDQNNIIMKPILNNDLGRIWAMLNQGLPSNFMKIIESRALNSLLLFGLNTANGFYTTLPNLHSFIHGLSKKNVTEPQQISPLIDTYFILNSLSNLYISTLYSTSDAILSSKDVKANQLEKQIVDILGWINNSINKNESQEALSTTQQNTYDWNGKILLDTINYLASNPIKSDPKHSKSESIETKTNETNTERILNLMQSFVNAKLPISKEAIEQLRNCILPTLNDYASTKQIPAFSLESFNTNETLSLTNSSSPRSAAPKGSNFNQTSIMNGTVDFYSGAMNLRGMSIPQLESMLKVCHQQNSQETSLSPSTLFPPNWQKVFLIKRHLLIRLCKEKQGDSFYTPRIETLAKDFEDILLALRNDSKNEISKDPLKNTDETIKTDTIPYNLSHLNDSDKQSCIATCISLLNYYTHKADGYRAYRLKNLFDTLVTEFESIPKTLPPVEKMPTNDSMAVFNNETSTNLFGAKLSVPKILDICAAIIAQKRLGTLPVDAFNNLEDNKNDSPVSVLEEITLRSNKKPVPGYVTAIMDLLQEGSIAPLIPTKYSNTMNDNIQSNSNREMSFDSNNSNMNDSTTEKLSASEGNHTENISSAQTINKKFSSAAASNINNLFYDANGPKSHIEYNAWKLLNIAAGCEGKFYDTIIPLGKPIPDFDKIYDATSYLVNLVLGKHNPSVGIMGTLINARINNDDLKSALSEFHKYALEFKQTPQMTHLMKRLINLNDTENLQKLVDVSSEIHTETNVLIDLLFAFIDLGRMKEAGKVIESPSFQYRPNRFDFYCSRYIRNCQTKELEFLVNALKDTKDDACRDAMYYNLLKVYERNQSKEEAIKLWEKMVENENSGYFYYLLPKSIAETTGGDLVNEFNAINEAKNDSQDDKTINLNDPSTTVTNENVVYKMGSDSKIGLRQRIMQDTAKIRNLRLLTRIIRSDSNAHSDESICDNISLPFKIPTGPKNTTTATFANQNEIPQDTENSVINDQGNSERQNQDFDKERQIMQEIGNGDVAKAYLLKQKLYQNSKNILSPKTYAALMEGLLKTDDNVLDALRLGEEMTSYGLYVPLPLIKSLLSRLSAQGKVGEIVERIPALISVTEVRNRINIPRYISYAYTNSGRFGDYITELEESCHQNELSNVKLPFGIVYGLSKEPDKSDRILELSKVYMDKFNIFAGYNTMFTYYFLSRQFEKARDLYNTILKPNLKPLPDANLVNDKTENISNNEQNDLNKEDKFDHEKLREAHLNLINICRDAKIKNDDAALKFLIYDMEIGRKQDLGLLYSFWISLKCHNGAYTEALNLFNEGVERKGLALEHFRVFALRELKNCLESNGTLVPFDISQRNIENRMAQ